MFRFLWLIAAVLFFGTAAWAFDYDEAVDGPLSGDPANPTFLWPVVTGSNTLAGSVTLGDNSSDYFRFEVPEGSNLDEIVLSGLDPLVDFWFEVKSDPGGEILYSGETDQSNLGLDLLSAMGLPHLPSGYYRFAFGIDDATVQIYELTFRIGRTLAYVDIDATGANDGSSWCDAYNHLTDALAAVGLNTEILIADGAYVPDRSNAAPAGTGDREATFALTGNVVLRGGYAGCGVSDPDERDVDLYETVISGDLAADDGSDFQNYDENSYNVLTMDDPAGSAALDGLTVTGGNANLADTHMRGAGLLISQGSVALTGCKFIRNRTDTPNYNWESGGAAVWVDNENSSSFENCTFIENKAENDWGSGGAIYAWNAWISGCVFVSNTAANSGGAINGDAHVVDSVFVDNHSGSGGGFNCEWGRTVLNSTFAGNSAAYGGGLGADDSHPTVVGSLFVGNSATVDGGGMSIIDDDAYMEIINCTFAENQALGLGGGLNAPSWAGESAISGGVFWGNTDSVGQDEYAQIHPQEDPSRTVIHYSVVQGWTGIYGGVGNHGDPPRFMGGPSGTWTADATRSGKPGQTTLYDGNADYEDNKLAGKFLNPDTTQMRQTLIVSNTATEITVWGDFSTLGTSGTAYKINDYRLQPDSPCIDAADNSAMLADIFDLDQDGDTTEPVPFDIDGPTRFSDDLCTTDTGSGDPPVVDMGAYEFTGASLDLSIGDRVWADHDEDGIQDEGEPGMGSVLVSLYDDMEVLQDITFTNAVGEYRLPVVNWSSEYYVRFIPPPEYRLTVRDQGGDDQQDSDADPDTGFTSLFQVCSLDHATPWDAGMVPLLPCIRPDEPIYLYAMTLDSNQNPVLHYMDPNQPSQVTGYNVYRSANAAIPKEDWPLVASDVVDMDEAEPNKQWVDISGQEPPPPGSIWYYQVTAYNGPPCDEEGPFGWPQERNCDNGLDDDLDTLYDCDDPDCARACDPLPIVLGDSWKYFKGQQEPAPYDPAVAAWAQPGFDDSGWDEGSSGFGYGTDCASLHGTVLDDMQHNYVSFYARMPFQVEDSTSIDTLTLTMDYDDGWVAYLNGVEVARSPGMGGTPGVPPTYDQTTQTGDHECSGSPGAANPPEELDLSGSMDLLVSGTNLLAIQGHNRALVSSDFSLIPTLSHTE